MTPPPRPTPDNISATNAAGASGVSDPAHGQHARESVRAPTAADMQSLGARLGRAMQAGDVVGLSGPLGSGKTTFAQGIAVGLEVAADRHVASPTFALVNQHPARVTFVHADFYRVKNEAELAELGLEEAYDTSAAALEWAERFPQVLPQDCLHITFVTDADGVRRLNLRPTGPRGQALAAALRG